MVLVGSRMAQPLDLLERGMAGGGWAAFETMQLPEIKSVMTAEDDVAMLAYALSRSPEGRKLIEWIMDFTVRQRLSVPGRTLEETALAAANLAGWQGAGQAIVGAIVRGGEILNGKGKA